METLAGPGTDVPKGRPRDPGGGLVRFESERIPGKGRGKHLGFPTINLRIPEGLELDYGIYACWVHAGGRAYPAALHYGPVPVFDQDEPSLEVHLLDTSLDEPPAVLHVEVVRWLRPVQDFPSPESLRAQMEQDVDACRRALGLDGDPPDRVAAELRRRGVDVRIHRFHRSTRTAQEAAQALGTTPERIVKSLVFLADGKPVLVLVSGAHRVSAAKLATVTGAARVRAADAQTVERVTGFPAGAVPPVGHTTQLPVYMDRALLEAEVVYAGAGAPDALFAVRPEDLRRAAAATLADLREGP